MIGKILDFVIGKATFEIKLSKQQDVTVLNYLRENGFFGCRICEGSIVVSCPCSKSKKVSALLDERNIKYKFRLYGLISKIKKLIKRKGILLAIVLCIALHIIFSGIIWTLDVTETRIPENEIRNTLRMLGVYEGVPKGRIDVKKLDMEFMISDNRFSWAHLNMYGTKADFELTEKTDKPQLVTDKKDVCNIVAKCDGIISRIDVYSGGKEVKNGQSVTKGELLISSFFETRVSGLLLRRARGTVIAETERCFEMIIPKNTHVLVAENNIVKHSLELFDRSLPIDGGNFIPKGKNTTLSETRKNVVLFGFLKLPVEYVTKNYTVYNIKEKQRTGNECEIIYNERFDSIKKEIQKTAEIISYDTTVEENESYCKFVTRICCREDIGEEKPFEIRENSY